jgi:alanyl-tRNA synthetase
LLHAALRETLGENATQRGSKVEADQLRFDFAHPKGLAPEELLKIEDSINRRISEGAVVSTQLMPIGDARKLGAMALFGEKYPDNVRVVRMGDFSTELCGGTHLTNTGQVGLCRVVKDELVSAGVRRISCLTGPRALGRLRELEALLKESAALAKAAIVEELPRKVAQLQDELRQVKRELSKYTGQSLVQLAEKLATEAPQVGTTRLIVHRAEGISREALKELVDHCRAKSDSAAVLVGMAVEDDKVALIAGLTKDLVAKGIKASDIVKAAAKVAGGGGGGRPDLAEAGGRFPEKLDEALETGAAALRAALAEG